MQGDLEDISSAKYFDFDTGVSFKRSRLAQIVWRFDQDQTRSKFFIEKHVLQYLSQNYEIFRLVKNVFVKMPLTKLARRYHSQRRPKQQGRVCKNWNCVSFLIWKDVFVFLMWKTLYSHFLHNIQRLQTDYIFPICSQQCTMWILKYSKYR